MAALSIGVVFILVHAVLSEEVFRPTNSGAISFGNFIPHQNYKVFAVGVKEEKVKSFEECLIRCVETKQCLSTNVNTTADDEGLHVCELLASDKHGNQSNFRPSKGFDHYSIASPCDRKPCKHQGKCIPVYTNYTYECKCLPGTLGKDCQIPDFRSCAQRYAAGYINSGLYQIISPDEKKIEIYCDHSNGVGWTMVFKSVSGVPLQQGPGGLWISSSLLESSSLALPINSSSRQHYKSRIIEHWQAVAPSQVRLSLYQNKAEVLRLVFNATGSDKTNWFSRDRLVTSPWTDIHSQFIQFFSIFGDNVRCRRVFYINRGYNGCPGDTGWMMLVELIPGACSYENQNSQFPILYSPRSSFITWQNPGEMAVADMMAIYIR